MNILSLFGYGLAGIAVLLAAYALKCVCRAWKTGRSPRPFAMPVFSLLAFAMMKVCWIAGGFVDQFNTALAGVLLATDYAVIIAIGWLLFHATKRRVF